MDEKDFLRNDEAMSEDATRPEPENQTEISEEQRAAQEKMEQIFKNVSANKQEPEPKPEETAAPEEVAQKQETQDVADAPKREIELMTVRRFSEEEKRAMAQKKQEVKKKMFWIWQGGFYLCRKTELCQVFGV